MGAIVKDVYWFKNINESRKKTYGLFLSSDSFMPVIIMFQLKNGPYVKFKKKKKKISNE